MGSCLDPALSSVDLFLDTLSREKEPRATTFTKENRGTYHLHGKTGNSSWKIKWIAPFRLGSFREYGL